MSPLSLNIVEQRPVTPVLSEFLTHRICEWKKTSVVLCHYVHLGRFVLRNVNELNEEKGRETRMKSRVCAKFVQRAVFVQWGESGGKAEGSRGWRPGEESMLRCCGTASHNVTTHRVAGL